MKLTTHTTYAWPLPNGVELRLMTDDATALLIDATFRDAARYRWLRGNPQWRGWEHVFTPKGVDAAIDAAMAKEAK